MIRPLITFLIITYSLSILLSVIVGATGGSKSKLLNLAFAAFFIPAIAVLVMQFGFDEAIPDAGWDKFPVLWLPVALFLMPLAIHIIALPVTAHLNNRKLPWQAWLTPDQDGLYHAPPDRKWGTITKKELLRKTLISAIASMIIVSIFAFFEEIGWRAWMLPRLIEQFGVRQAVFLSAVIWALWHVPFIIGGIQHIKGIPTWVILILMPLGHIGAGSVLGWLWLQNGSIWIVTLAHGALNNWGQFAFKFMADSPQPSDLSKLNQDAIIFAAVNFALLLIGIILLLQIT